MKKIAVHGEYLCAFCGSVTKVRTLLPKDVVEKDPEMLTKFGIICPTCGEYIQQYIPTGMRKIIRTLAGKGYKIAMINPKVLGIVFNHKLTEQELREQLPPLPYEFSYDMTEPEGDILLNARIAAMDFEGLDEAKYYEEAMQNLEDWVYKLPQTNNKTYLHDFSKTNKTGYEDFVTKEGLKAIKVAVEEKEGDKDDVPKQDGVDKRS